MKFFQQFTSYMLTNRQTAKYGRRKIRSAFFDVEYVYGFVWWGVCKQSRWRHSVTEPSQDGGYVLLWQRYDNNKMVAMRYFGNVMATTRWRLCVTILHLQQYSHRLNLFFLFVLQLLSGTFLILRRIQRGIIMNVHRFACKVPVILVKF